MLTKEALFSKESLRRNALPLFLGGGAIILTFILLVVAGVSTLAGQSSTSSGDARNQPNGQYQPNGQDSEDRQYQGGNSGPEHSAEDNGSYNGSYYAQGGGQTLSTPGQGDGGDVTSGYWARQRSQDQQARAYDQTIRDTNTVRDTETGEIHTDVPNGVADPGIQQGTMEQVPTPELPTPYAAPAPAPDPSPATE